METIFKNFSFYFLGKHVVQIRKHKIFQTKPFGQHVEYSPRFLLECATDFSATID